MFQIKQVFHNGAWYDDYELMRLDELLCAGCFTSMDVERTLVYRCVNCGIYECAKCLPDHVFYCAGCGQTD